MGRRHTTIAGGADADTDRSTPPRIGTAHEHPSVPREGCPLCALPPDVPTFTGRDGLLETLDAWVQPCGQMEATAVGLVGVAGVGKSALALHAAHLWRDRFPGGLVWVDVQAESGVCGALRRVVALYGYREHAAQIGDDVSTLAGLTRAILRDKRGLLVFDGADDLPGDELDSLLPGVPGSVILLTSRRPLPALERAGRLLQVDVMSEDEALALLDRLAGPDQQHGEPVEGSHTEPAEGCHPESVECCHPEPAEGCHPEPVECCHPEPAEGCHPEPVERCHPELVEGSRPEPVERCHPELVEGGHPELVEGGHPELVEGSRRELAARLGYLPLALDLAGRRMRDRGWTTAEMLHHLDTAADRLTTLALPAAGETEHNVALAFALSYEPLDGEDQDLFRALSPFAPAGFTPRAVAAVLCRDDIAGVEAALKRLDALSLVRCTMPRPELRGQPVEGRHPERRGELVEPLVEGTRPERLNSVELVEGRHPELVEGSRYTLHPLLRSYAVALAGQAGERDLWAGEHAHYYAVRADWAGRQLADPATAPQAVAMAAVERGNLLAAQRTSVVQQLWAQAVGLAYWLDDLFKHVGCWNDRRGALETGIEAARSGRLQRDEAGLAHNLGLLAQNHGDYAEARRLYEEALDIARELDDRASVAVTLHNLGVLAQRQEDYAEARHLHEQATQAFERLGDRVGVARTLHQLGNVAYRQGDYVEARRQYGASLEVAEALGDRAGVATTTDQLGMLAYLQGNVEKARWLHKKSLALRRAIGDDKGIAASLHQLAVLAEDQGEAPEARRLYHEYLDMVRGLGDRTSVAQTLHRLGRLAEDDGDLEEAERLFAEGLVAIEPFDSPEAAVTRRSLQRVRERLQGKPPKTSEVSGG